MAVVAPNTVPRQVRTLLLADLGVTAHTGTRVYSRPLKREGDTAAERMSTRATPDAFEPDVPYWIRGSIVVGQRVDRGADPGSRPGSNRRMRHTITLAYYGPPTENGEWTIEAMALAAAKALDGATVTHPDGTKARIVVPHFVSGLVPVPEYPGAGYVALERIEAVGVFRRM